MAGLAAENLVRTRTGNPKRRERLEKVIGPLLEVDDFSIEEAKLICLESNPAYVTRTVKELASDRRLLCFEVSGETRYRWIDPNQFDLTTWIENQIHGLQVKETPEAMR